MKKLIIITFLLVLTLSPILGQEKVIVGAENTDEYFSDIQGKRVAVMGNHTSLVGEEHLVDFLIRNKMNITTIFAPEHGFRGTADAGEGVSNTTDKKTGIPIRSLYDGKGRKPSRSSMNTFDVLLIDVQDVGLRFYTYYITMFKLMDACAEYNKKIIILDRPNPNGHYVDGPILDMKYKSAVGWLPIPVVHGMTLGELAFMINGEKWLPQKRVCDLKVAKCKNYTHRTMYELPVAPSPNLPNMKSIYLYPSTCLFEGTVLSLGRGTSFPFQVYGHPSLKGYTFSFTPKSVPGAKNPPLLNRKCYGVDLRNIDNEEIFSKGLDLSYIIDAYKNMPKDRKFFIPFFENLIGVSYVRTMIIQGKSADEIKKMWQKDVENFKKQRRPYLLYAE